ncbi:hypothetical protein [Empedobacter brevis]|uniref:hypothetical protein n=1 Tax=Empedobacter brevis TaxID=247 RepID=UPI00333EFC1C
MKTVKSIFVMTLFFIISSCSTVSKLQGNKYTYKSKQRTLELVFTDEVTCILKNTFHCPDVEEKYRIISTECNYTKKGDTIFLSNKNLSYHSDLYIEIPSQNSEKCQFLNEKSREKKFSIGPSYATDYEKYGIVPNITTDTLYIIKNKIVLFKKNQNRSIGFIFK